MEGLSSFTPADDIDGVGTHLTVLLAEDDDDLRALVVAMLEAGGCPARGARDGGEVIDMMSRAASPMCS